MKTDLTINRDIFLQDPQDKRFRTITWASIFLYAVLGVAAGLVKVSPPQREEAAQLPPRIAKLIIPKPQAPPPVVQVKKEEPKVEETATEVKKEEPKPEQTKEPPQEVAKQEGPSPEEIRAQQEAQRKMNMEVAMNSGLLKLLKQSETKTESVPDQKLRKVFSEIKGLSQAPQAVPGAALQLSPESSRGIDDIVAKLEKSIKESKAASGDSAVAGSGGINPIIGDLQKDVGRSSLAERKTTAVESPFQIKGFEDGKSPRTYESIAQVVDSYKGGISFLYNKALRENPTLRGTVTVEFIVAASGDVINCHVVSSSMNNPVFEEALIKRVLQWKFSPVPGGDITITYPIVFSVSG